MSTSPSRAPLHPRLRNPAEGVAVEPFPYDAVYPIAAAGNAGDVGDVFPSGLRPGTASEVDTREALVRSEGRQEGAVEARKMFEQQLAHERASLASALTQFTRDRAAYFQKIEGEVVQLALSIARKILHREAQVDPLVVAGIVRVALEKIDGASGVVLRINPQNAADWRRYLAIQLEPQDLPQINEDPSLAIDTCVLETAMGTAAFGLDIQLKEIEAGLADLLGARPGATS